MNLEGEMATDSKKFAAEARLLLPRDRCFRRVEWVSRVIKGESWVSVGEQPEHEVAAFGA